MDYEQIKKSAEGYRADMTRFLREMISHPSESCEEKEVVAWETIVSTAGCHRADDSFWDGCCFGTSGRIRGDAGS